MSEIVGPLAVAVMIGLVFLWVWWIFGVTIAMFLDVPEWVGYLLVPVFFGVCALVGFCVVWVAV